MNCTRRRKDGQPCGGNAVNGTDACTKHAGVKAELHKAKGRLVLTAREHGFSDEEMPGVGVDTYMLRLTAGAYRQAKMYERLVADAYDAAERLREATSRALAEDDLPAHVDNLTDRERALYDLQRVFREGGVSVLIGAKWGHTVSKDGGDLYEADEGIRSLVNLWNEERDRAFRFAKDCRSAGLEERLVVVAEQTAESIAVVLRAALADLGHDLTDPAVLQVVSSRVRELVAS